MQCMYVCLLDHRCMICWKQTTAPERREVAQLSPELQNIDFTFFYIKNKINKKLKINKQKHVKQNKA